MYNSNVFTAKVYIYAIVWVMDDSMILNLDKTNVKVYI